MDFIGIDSIEHLLKVAGDIVPYLPRQEWDMLHENYINITNQTGTKVVEERIKEVLEKAYSDANFWQQSGASTDKLMSFGPTIRKIREGLPGVLEELYWPKATAQNMHTYKNVKNLMGEIEIETNIDPSELSDEELDKYMVSEEFLTKREFSKNINVAKLYFWSDASTEIARYSFYIGIKTVEDCLSINEQIFLPANHFWKNEGWNWEPIEFTGERADKKLPEPEKVIPIDRHL